MSNVNNPRGLWPRRYLNGAPWNGAARRCYVPASDATYDIYLGSLVIPSGSADANGVMGVTAVTATNSVVLGVVVGVDSLGGVGGTGREASIYRVKATERYIYVADDPEILFSVQDNGLGTAAAGWVGGSADLTGFTSGSSVSGLSSIVISGATAGGTNSTDDVLIHGLDPTPDNSIAAYARWLVKLQHHYNAPGATGI
jgi:hypothetical protein